MCELSAPDATFERFAALDFEDAAAMGNHRPISMMTLDAKLASALTHVAPSDFMNTLRARKEEFFSKGEMITGRQIMYLVDQHFRMSDQDGAVYDTEHLFSVTLKGENLTQFIAVWD